MSKSPLLTGEDPEGAAGLQALMSLRTSLSPALHAVDEAWEKGEGVRRRKWGALVSAATEKKEIEALPRAVESVKKEGS